MSLDHLNERILDKVKERLWIVSGSLKGVGSIFTQAMSDPCFNSEELFGLGQLLKKLSEELSILEDILNCGHDSTADKRNGLNNNE